MRSYADYIICQGERALNVLPCWDQIRAHLAGQSYSSGILLYVQFVLLPARPYAEIDTSRMKETIFEAMLAICAMPASHSM